MPHNRRQHVNHGGNQPPDLHLDAELIENHNPTIIRCCVPTGCLEEDTPINLDRANGHNSIVKVECNNDHCNQSRFMHKICFDEWEQSVLTYLRSCGRARSWSEKQRLQNLWTKKGYDLAFKACSCKCGRGHLRKDLDWVAPRALEVDNVNREKKKRRKHKSNYKPALGTVPLHQVLLPVTPPAAPPTSRGRANSLGSTESGSPPSSGAESPVSPAHTTAKKKGKVDFFSDRSRHGSGGNGIFSRRLDFSSFNALPKHKINSYHIKMEDEGNHGNDETRCFILSSLAAAKTSRIPCVFCQNNLVIYDRYPLVDGTFFLSPRQHIKTCIQVKLEGRNQNLYCVCMSCLEGWTTLMRCKFCFSPWDGSHLILGTMYSFDILAATPCCTERLKCNKCHQLVVLPEQRLNFSDYSHPAPCPHCSAVDFHFIKSLSSFRRDDS